MQPFPEFVGPSYTLPSVNIEAQRCVNLFPEVDALGTGKERNTAALVSTPGLRKIATAGDGPIRGIYTASNGRVFLVSLVTLYELVDDVPVERGHIDTGSDYASFSDNGLQLIVVSGSGYIFTFEDNTFQRIWAEGFPDATDVVFIDQYFIANAKNTQQFSLSNLAEGLLWDGLDVAAKEGAPDNLTTILADHRELFLFGEQSSEVWFNSGDLGFPFSRREGAYIERGIIGPGAKAKIDDGVFFWGQDKSGNAMAYRINGYQPQRISNHAIEQVVNAYGDISGAICWTYQFGGHSFWVTNFPGVHTTWVFDIATGLWHERMSGTSRHRAQNHTFDGSRHLVGDYENGNIYELDHSVYTDDGATITRERSAPHISTGMERASHFAFQLDCEGGSGLAVGQGSDPQVQLSWSDDGGHAFKGERWAPLGKRGEYGQRVIWRKLGATRDRVYRVRFTDPVPFTILSAYTDVQASKS
jgi:hypothetical protein